MAHAEDLDGSSVAVVKRSAEPGQVQVCGYRLLEAVRVLCGGMVMTKRSAHFSLAPLYDELELPMSNTLDGMEQDGEFIIGSVDNEADNGSFSSKPTYSMQKWFSQGKAHPRFRRNIIDECCKRPCSHMHMLNYCRRV